MQINEAREFIKFLRGAVPWNGTWFGEYAPGERGAYWWRKHLDEAIAALIAAPAAPQQAEPVAWMAFGGSIVHAVTRNAMDPIEAERFDVPLYLHPPAAEVQRLRDAARAVLQEYSAHGGLRPSSMNPLIIDLHRAMEGKQC